MVAGTVLVPLGPPKSSKGPPTAKQKDASLPASTVSEGAALNHSVLTVTDGDTCAAGAVSSSATATDTVAGPVRR